MQWFFLNATIYSSKRCTRKLSLVTSRVKRHSAPSHFEISCSTSNKSRWEVTTDSFDWLLLKKWGQLLEKNETGKEESYRVTLSPWSTGSRQEAPNRQCLVMIRHRCNSSLQHSTHTNFTQADLAKTLQQYAINACRRACGNVCCDCSIIHI